MIRLYTVRVFVVTCFVVVWFDLTIVNSLRVISLSLYSNYSIIITQLLHYHNASDAILDNMDKYITWYHNIITTTKQNKTQ